MKISKVIIAGLIGVLFLQPAFGANPLANIYRKVSPTAGLLEYRIEGQVQTKQYEGTAFCIQKDSSGRAIFMTTIIPSYVRTEMLKGFKITPAGMETGSRACEFMGVDPLTGIGFARTVDAVDWPVLNISQLAKISVGQQVVSVGLSGKNMRAGVQVSIAYVGGVFYVPQSVYRVTGGTLFGAGSLVFDDQGSIIGIVTEQLPESMTLSSRKFSGSVAVTDSTHKRYFLGADSFMHVLKNIPTPDKPIKSAWLGVTDFNGITADASQVYGVNSPAVMVGYVVPGKTADKAGLKQRDLIVSIDGRGFGDFELPRFLEQQFMRRVQLKGVGNTLNLGVLRDSKKINISVKIVETPKRSWQADTFYFKQIGLMMRDKVEMDRYHDRGPMANTPGVLVLQVAPKSPTAKAALKPRDLIVGVNNQPVQSVETIKRIVGDEDSKEPVMFRIKRGVTEMTITVSR